jgi:hypothetical protein
MFSSSTLRHCPPLHVPAVPRSTHLPATQTSLSAPVSITFPKLFHSPASSFARASIAFLGTFWLSKKQKNGENYTKAAP